MTCTAFRRQFVIAREPVAPGPGWRHHDLPDGWVLSHHGDLDISERAAADGRIVRVLGRAYGGDAPDRGGSGRFALLDWPHIRGDGAAGLLPIFYGAHGDTFALSSNAGLAALPLGGEPGTPDHPDPLRHHSRQNYVPRPGSRFAGVRCVMRDQQLNVPEGRVEHHPAPIRPLASHAAAVETVGAELGAVARDLRARTEGTIFVQLTAGLDSRTVLAAFAAAGIAFETVTLRSPAKPEEDVTVARAISQRLGLRHHVATLQTPPDPAAGQAYWLQTSGGMNGWDLTDLFPGHAYRFVKPGDVMVGGSCFELGRQKFAPDFADLTLETATGAEIWRRLIWEEGPPVFTGFIDDWLDWRRRHPYDLNFVTTHYLDQRLGAWAATAMAGLDLLDGTVLHPANNARILSALITPEIADQAAGRLQRDVIGRLAPELADFPFNPPPPPLRRLGKQVRRSASRLRKHLKTRIAIPR